MQLDALGGAKEGKEELPMSFVRIAEALNRAMERGVLVQRSMGPRYIIIGGISA
jgi:hypothetical protein